MSEPKTNEPKESWDERKKRENEGLTFAEKIKTLKIDKTSLKTKN